MVAPVEHLSLPPVDERLAVPETPYEVIDGKQVYVPPCDRPHGDRHMQLAIALGLHVAPGFTGSIDLLMRTSHDTDIAPDVTILPSAPDPVTGRQQVPHLAFEVATTTRLSALADRARRLATRGVRRVFAVEVFRERVHEWSQADGAWHALPAGAAIEDPALAAPLPVATLVRAIATDDVVLAALRATGHPALAAARDEGHKEGHDEGRREMLAEAILDVLAARRISFTDADRARILAEPDPARLGRWLRLAVTCRAVDQLA